MVICSNRAQQVRDCRTPFLEKLAKMPTGGGATASNDGAAFPTGTNAKKRCTGDEATFPTGAKKRRIGGGATSPTATKKTRTPTAIPGVEASM